jgi:hypothetical protein
MTDMQLDQGKNLFLFLVPGKDQPQADYMWTAIREVIVPSAMRVRDQIVIRDARRASSTSGDAPLKRIVLTFDGEHEHLTATLDLLVDKVPEEWKGLGVELLKYAASASKHQQPCDVSCCYSVLKQAEKLLEELSPPAYHDEVESLLEVNLSGASARTYTRFLSRLPDLLSKAFTSVNIKKGWKRAGIYPLDAVAIMQRCTTWHLLNSCQADAILASIETLTEGAKLSGEVSDASMQAAVGNAIDFEVWMHRQCECYKSPKTPIQDQALNRHRVCWINHQSITDMRRIREEERIAADALKEVKKKETQMRREEKEQQAEEKRKRREERASKKEAKLKKAQEKAAKKAKVASGKSKKLTRVGRVARRPTWLEE